MPITTRRSARQQVPKNDKKVVTQVQENPTPVAIAKKTPALPVAIEEKKNPYSAASSSKVIPQRLAVQVKKTPKKPSVIANEAADNTSLKVDRPVESAGIFTFLYSLASVTSPGAQVLWRVLVRGMTSLHLKDQGSLTQYEPLSIRKNNDVSASKSGLLFCILYL